MATPARLIQLPACWQKGDEAKRNSSKSRQTLPVVWSPSHVHNHLVLGHFHGQLGYRTVGIIHVHFSSHWVNSNVTTVP